MKIRIGTRKSPLARWQATTYKSRLSDEGYDAELIEIESTGDKNLTQPLYSFGITGVFTKELDIALLENNIDIAVHSAKDIPTTPAKGLMISSVLKRGAHSDILLLKNNAIDLYQSNLVIATSSIRRRAQWLERFPHHQMEPIRGNVQTRLQKFADNEKVDAVIFAKAGLERMELLPEYYLELDWMLPAPSQGIVAAVCREEDEQIKKILAEVSDVKTQRIASIEREFMRTLMGGCSVPISCLAIENDTGFLFKGAIHATDGSRSYKIEKQYHKDIEHVGMQAAKDLLNQDGCRALLDEIRTHTHQS
ncbi:MAG: hydroxymethylbilane synthase [Chitinophagaceae bacterium]